VVLVGFSQGGMTALAALLTAPEAFAGAAMLSGRLLDAALAAAAPAERLAGRRVLVTHGTEDPRLRVDHARHAQARLAALPLALEYHEFPARHAITDECRRVATAWAARAAGVADRPADPAALERARRARGA
jgi:phospholipase/carboxylesterase